MDLRIPQMATSGKEALGPFCLYLLTRGLVMNFNSEGALVSDGVGSCVSFPSDAEHEFEGLFSTETYAHLLEEVQHHLGVRLVGFHGGSSNNVAFRVGDYAISGGCLNEVLLGRLLTLENLVRKRVLLATGIDESQLMERLNIGAALADDVSYGKVGPASFQQALDAYNTFGFPMEQAFFVLNATNIAEDMRNGLAAACYHCHAMNSGIRTINQTRPLGAPAVESESEPWEMRIASAKVAELSYAFTSSVTACATALDLLYILFVYLTREPFLNPEFPSKLYFPDAPGRNIFQYGGVALTNDPPAKELPYAIANLVPDHFKAFRSTKPKLSWNVHFAGVSVGAGNHLVCVGG